MPSRIFQIGRRIDQHSLTVENWKAQSLYIMMGLWVSCVPLVFCWVKFPRWVFSLDYVRSIASWCLVQKVSKLWYSVPFFLLCCPLLSLTLIMDNYPRPNKSFSLVSYSERKGSFSSKKQEFCTSQKYWAKFKASHILIKMIHLLLWRAVLGRENDHDNFHIWGEGFQGPFLDRYVQLQKKV